MKNQAFFPAVCMKNAEILFNFGATSFKYPPKVLTKIIQLLNSKFCAQINNEMKLKGWLYRC